MKDSYHLEKDITKTLLVVLILNNSLPISGILFCACYVC